MIALNLLIGPLLAFIGWITLEFPPKSINSFYGYRTSSSMSSQDRWDFANKYNSKLILNLGLNSCILQIALLIFFDEIVAILSGATFISLGIIYAIISTERAIKRKFDTNQFFNDSF